MQRCEHTQKIFTAGCHCLNCEHKRTLRRNSKRRNKQKRHEEHSRYYAKYAQANKQQLLKILGGKCALCNGLPIKWQFDFHEINGRIATIEKGWKKGSAPSNLLKTKKGFDLLVKHIDELVPLCRKCHAKLKGNNELNKQMNMWMSLNKPLTSL